MAEYEARQILTIECPRKGCPAPKRVIKDGFKNGQQRYECKACGNNFFAEGKALYKQFPADHIGAALDMYYSGMSYKQVAEHMEDNYDVPEPSKGSVHAWVKGYTRLALDYMRGKVGSDGTSATATGKRIKADVGDEWVADEMVVRVGGRKMWNWNIMDKKTRYILAVRVSPTRNTEDAMVLFEQAKMNAAREPESITTDGLGSYVDAARAVFPKTKHIVSEGIYEPVNNNLSERLQGSFRQRTKTQRGLEMQRTANEYMRGWALDYNHFKDHEAHGGGSPAEAAGVAQQVPWEKWEDIARLGGEVAEPRVISQTTIPKKTGPKSKSEKAVIDIVREYLEAQESKKVKASNKGKKSLPVAPFSVKPKPKGAKPGRGKAGLKL